MPGAGVVCLFVKEGVVCSTLCRREQDDHALYDQKDQIDLDLSDFEKERNQ